MKNKFILHKEIYEQIAQTIGRCPPETGGFLGSSDGVHIDHYYFDHSAKTTGSTYTPDTEAVNADLRRWADEGVRLVGNIHSHPHGSIRPSVGDCIYAKRIMDAVGLDSFVILIAQVDAGQHENFTLFPYSIDRFGMPHELMLEIETGGQRPTSERFSRIETFYPLEVLRRKTLVIIGVGGAIGFAEDMARSGVGNFVLIDGDVVDEANIGTQQVYVQDVGKPKVDVLRDRILSINPEAHIVAAKRFLDDGMRDEELAALIGDKLSTDPTDVLICGCTDSFHAQARSAALAMKYGTPYLAAQLYAGGEGGEIYFSYPDVTVGGCPRCAMKSRYEAYANGYQNAVTSAGCPIFATGQLNAQKGQIALMLLLYRADEHCRYNSMLDAVTDRNFVMLRMAPTAGERLGLHIFDGATDGNLAFFGETVWIPQSPDEGCPLCHGAVDLSTLRGIVPDTREASK